MLTPARPSLFSPRKSCSRCIAKRASARTTQNGHQSVRDSLPLFPSAHCSDPRLTTRNSLPAATASYRLLPHIDITKRIPPELCSKFAACFAPGVIEEFEDEDGTQNVRVANARKDTVSREVLRHAEFADSVKLGRIRDHFICEPLLLSLEETSQASKPSEAIDLTFFLWLVLFQSTSSLSDRCPLVISFPLPSTSSSTRSGS